MDAVTLKKETEVARFESNISTEHEYTDRFVGTVDALSIDSSIGTLLKSQLVGCGRVDLVSIFLKVNASDAKQKFKFGLTEAGSSASVTHAAGKLNGWTYISNSMNFGTDMVKNILPEDSISRQIQPKSADLPDLRIMITRDAGMVVVMEILVKVRGVRTKYISLN